MDSSEKALKIIIRNNDGTSNDITMYSVDGKLPTTIEFRGVISTNEVTVSETEITDDDPSTLVDSPKDDLESQAVRLPTLIVRKNLRMQTKVLSSQRGRPTGSQYTSQFNKP
jgi:hypothetical protein